MKTGWGCDGLELTPVLPGFGLVDAVCEPELEGDGFEVVGLLPEGLLLDVGLEADEEVTGFEDE